MNRVTLKTIILAMGLLFAGCAANVAWADAVADCNQREDHDKTIRGCAQLIEAKTLSPNDLAVAYFFRGRAFEAKKDWENAIKDYVEAVRLNHPELVSSVSARILLLIDEHRDHPVAQKALEELALLLRSPKDRSGDKK